MTAAMGPGDFVECVQCGDPVIGFHPGVIYIVEGAGYWNGRPWLTCVGKPIPADFGYGPEYGPGWTASAFRPIYRPKASIIEALKQPAPEMEPA